MAGLLDPKFGVGLTARSVYMNFDRSRSCSRTSPQFLRSLAVESIQAELPVEGILGRHAEPVVGHRLVDHSSAVGSPVVAEAGLAGNHPAGRPQLVVDSRRGVGSPNQNSHRIHSRMLEWHKPVRLSFCLHLVLLLGLASLVRFQRLVALRLDLAGSRHQLDRPPSSNEKCLCCRERARKRKVR